MSIPWTRQHCLLDLAETKNPGSVAELIMEDEEMAQNTLRNLFEYVQKGGMPIDFATEQTGIPAAQFMQEMESNGYCMPQTA